MKTTQSITPSATHDELSMRLRFCSRVFKLSLTLYERQLSGALCLSPGFPLTNGSCWVELIVTLFAAWVPVRAPTVDWGMQTTWIILIHNSLMPWCLISLSLSQWLLQLHSHTHTSVWFMALLIRKVVCETGSISVYSVRKLMCSELTMGNFSIHYSSLYLGHCPSFPLLVCVWSLIIRLIKRLPSRCDEYYRHK